MNQIVTFEHIFSATSNGVIATDITGKVVLVNEQAGKILSVPSGSMSQRHIRELMPLTWQHVSICLQTGHAQLGCHVRGEHVSLVVNITPITEDDRIIGAVCNFQETEQFEQAAQQLESYRRISRQQIGRAHV